MAKVLLLILKTKEKLLVKENVNVNAKNDSL
jgi:hypothetical protein